MSRFQWFAAACHECATALRALSLVVLLSVVFASFARAETLDWSAQPSVNLKTTSNVQNFGTAGETSATTSATSNGTFASNSITLRPTYTRGSLAGVIEMLMDASNDNESSYLTTTIQFNEPVYDVSLSVSDIDQNNLDWHDKVIFSALTPTNTTVYPTSGFAWNGSEVTYTNATGTAMATDNSCCGLDDNSSTSGNVTVTFSGPVKTITVRLIAADSGDAGGDPNSQNLLIGDVTFKRAPRVKIAKTSQGSTGTFDFNVSNGLNMPGQTSVWSSTTLTASATTTVIGTPVNSAIKTLYAISTATTLTETVPASGWRITAASCTDSNNAVTGNTGSFGSLSGQVVTIPSANVKPGAEFTCSITNTKIPTVKLQVTTVGGASTPSFFSFTQTNLATTPSSITTTAANTATPLSPSSHVVSVTGTQVTITQTPPVGFKAASVSCTDANSSITGNTGSFGSLSGEQITIANTRIVTGADITCVLTNNKLPTLTITMISTGNVGPFTFTGTNGWASQTITTTAVNAGVVGATQIFSAASVATTISHSIPAGWMLYAYNCTGSLTGNFSLNYSTGDLSINASAMAPGSALACTFTDQKTPTFKVQVSTIGGVGGPFTFSQSNLATTPSNITTTAASTATPLSPTGHLVWAVGSDVSVTQTSPSGFAIASATCTDSNNSITGNSGSFGTLAGNQITMLGSRVVAGADITCLLVSHKLPTITLTVISNGMTGNFDFAGTNGFGTQTIATVTPGVGVTGLTKTLAAASTATSITETLNFSYIMVSASCTGLSAGSPTINTTAGTISFAAVSLEPGVTINCTITNEAAQPLLSLANAGSPATVSTAGSAISYTLNITNVGNVPLTSIAVSNGVGPVTCSTSGNATIANLPPSANETCTVNYTTTQADFDGSGGGDGDIDNSATAQTTYGGSLVTASGSSTVLLVIAPQLSIFKSANTPGPVSANNFIAYTYFVTNTGNVTINNVTINDVHSAFGVPPVPGSEMLQTDSLPSGDSADASANDSWDSLAPGDTITFNSTYTVVQADVDNQ